MTETRFDQLTRRMAQTASRRRALRAAVGSALAAAVAWRGPGATTAQVEVADVGREYQRRCETGSQCQGGKAACRRIRDTCPDDFSTQGIICKRCNLEGRRCCGLEGAFCSRDSCNCCGDLFCDFRTNKCAAF